MAKKVAKRPFIQHISRNGEGNVQTRDKQIWDRHVGNEEIGNGIHSPIPHYDVTYYTVPEQGNTD